MPFDLLDGLRVVDFSTEISGPYATKLLADAGADVVKVESTSGDPLRSWTASGTELAGFDGPLFEYLNAGKRSIIGSAASPEARDLAAAGSVVVESGQLDLGTIARWCADVPRLVIASVTPFGRRGPWADRPATEFTLQAECGSVIGRGTADRDPISVGGRIGEWVAGVYTAIGVLAAARGARHFGRGEHVDVSVFESMCNTMTVNSPLSITMNPGTRPFPLRTLELPSVEPTADGYVGFCTITAQQFKDFLVMIGRSDLIDDSELATFRGRRERRAELSAVIQDWTTKRTTAAIIELATMYRVPVAPIGTPGTIPLLDHFVARDVFAPSPSGRFVQPRTSYVVDGRATRASSPAPLVGEHDGLTWDHPRAPAHTDPVGPLPLEGVRIVDATAFWAGPSATHVLALLGADVIHVESIQHPDGMRLTFTGNLPSIEAWWESSSGFQLSNVNKRGITLDLDHSEGRELFLALVARSDAIVENFSPRVLDNFGITWDSVHAVNGRAVMMRMPAFGLDGPWRDRTGFAQNMEQATGMAWITGFGDGGPVIPRGACDPIAGMHAAFALLAVLAERDRTGHGHFVESTMVEAALNVAAEVVIEHSAFGVSLTRNGNRGPVAAPQGLYACRGEEHWLALAVATDEHWSALRALLGDPLWAQTKSFATATGRRHGHDLIDKHLGEWATEHDVEDAVEGLIAHGIPAARVVDPIELLDNPQLRARGMIEPIDSPLLGHHETLSLPFRFASRAEPWTRHPAPTLGQHNREVLTGLVGLDDADLERLEREAVIGREPIGVR